AVQAPTAVMEGFDDPRTIGVVAKRFRRRDGKPQADERIRVPRELPAIADLRSRDDAGEVRVEIEVGAQNSDVGGLIERARPRGGREEHAAADGEAESAYRHPSGVRQREGAPERRVDDLGCSRLELPLLDERELREHDEISGAVEG